MLDATNIEKNNDKVTVIAITELLECPICFSNIEDDGSYYIMPCCKNKIHLQCLINWYSTHSNQTSCFMCNQPNKFYTDFLATDVLESRECIINTSDESLPSQMITVSNLSTNNLCNSILLIVFIVFIVFGVCI